MHERSPTPHPHARADDRRLDRRRVLAGLGATVGAAALPRTGLGGSTAAAQTPGEGPFAWGVASFDPAPTSVLLWTRVEPPAGATSLRWLVARDPDLAEVVAEGQVPVPAGGHGCVTLDAGPLEPGRPWWYAFETTAGERSTVGRTRTLPAPDHGLGRARLGVVSCSRFADGPFAAYAHLAEREVDLVVHLGDYVYEDGGAGARDHEPPHRLVTEADYHARYAQHRADPDLQALHARHPFVVVWDDHEIAGNAWRDGAAAHDPGRDGPWEARRAAAVAAHHAWLPCRLPDPAQPQRIWRHLDLGRLGRLVCLDTRLWGRDRQATTADEVHDPGRTLLGADQLAWLEGHLGDDRPGWTLLANQVMFHPLRVPSLGGATDALLRGGGFVSVGGEVVNADQWDGYAPERERVARAMGARGGMVVLTGDVHSTWAWEGPANDGGQPAMVELVTPSVTSASFADRLGADLPPGLIDAAIGGLADDLAHVETSSHGYLIVDLTPDRVHAEWWYVDLGGGRAPRFGAARRAPRPVPMRFEEVDRPLADPPAPTPAAPATGSGGAPPVPGEAGDGGDGLELPVPVPVAAGGATAVVLAAAAAVALRRRRG